MADLNTDNIQSVTSGAQSDLSTNAGQTPPSEQTTENAGDTLDSASAVSSETEGPDTHSVISSSGETGGPDSDVSLRYIYKFLRKLS